MPEYKLGEVEARFADIIWRNEPLTSGELVKLSEKELKWKKSTTYTILKRLCERGIFKNTDGVVTSLVTKDEFKSLKSTEFIDENFDGSLPSFIAAFSSGRKLTKDEVDSLRKFINECE